MPTIGAPLRKWTLLLLLCSVPTYATDHAANEISTANSGATAASSITTPAHSAGAPSPSPPPSPSSSPSSLRRYNDSETACPARTINYITHTLPQQCAKASWSAAKDGAFTTPTTADAQATADTQTKTIEPRTEGEGQLDDKISSAISSIALQAQATGAVESIASGTTSESEAELETDSPFDNANFLSFEEWKKKNLEQVGQSPENVGQGRAAPSGQPARRRPVNVNALDSLGDEGEIEIDFTGFGTPGDKEDAAGNTRQGAQEAGAMKVTGEGRKAAPSSWTLSKDAGKTCKERFNYASFDCAATVLKTNKQAKSATSILVENKDSYMLNECSADNKFLIVELCDDIYVDTIVLANYEFFSSMFRHFRVSVSDRYPVKMERWRTLGTFEARNSRDIQPFLITEPQIWARYLRLEFLTQFGNEFYCPLSLLRVHGTTMMEQFRREEEEARGIEDDDSDLEAESRDIVKPAEDSGPLPPDQIPVPPVKDDIAHSQIPLNTANSAASEISSSSVDMPSQSAQLGREPSAASGSAIATPGNESAEASRNTMLTVSSSPAVKQRGVNSETDLSTNHDTSSTGILQPSASLEASLQDPKRGSDASVVVSSPPGPQSSGSSSTSSTNIATSVSSPSSQPAKPVTNTTASRGSFTQPNPAVPSTQESFFKSIHKRLLYLEANSTLSLQYIEEQSRSLRDAFLKVEKRQLAKTEKFLDHLNSTVMAELKGFRSMYDQLWQSTVIELESMKERQRNEMGEIGARLSLLADELVWQKRMAVVQSTLLLVCLGLVLFVRSGTLGSSNDVPIAQHLGSRYTSLFETPPRNNKGSGQRDNGAERRRRTFRNMWRSDTSAGLSDRDHASDAHQPVSDAETDGARSPLQNEYSPSPPTPNTPPALATHDARHSNGMPPTTPREQRDDDVDHEIEDNSDDQAARIQVLETQSGPATPNGTRDSRPSWEEVDRAMDELKAGEQGLSVEMGSPGRGKEKNGKRKGKGKGKGGKEMGSPLRRAYSSFGGDGGGGDG
ncbi:hypothetical protein NX059_002196 [Plenodomus lindquistii]|nr:hypothetical protein NX059_002196 [Plenodomus lindquistii]